ncbi:hypothetical protein KNT92_gp059 [Klebsiella phage Mineola]|uniref:Uncharacterized protein n=1 Tax=Klebsiella phage Mineola TaxID=2234047 RepID=A0A2Z4QAA1_9CAUD|nr:hypothetical protein KNT92_gp059 [Klebsiella phage Mineola]AWY06954.1 hypothetical protein CPT_Mineola_059 [Klebsiella phage Mineola]
MRKVILYTEIFTSRWVFDSVRISNASKEDVRNAQRLAYDEAGKSPAFVKIEYIITDSALIHTVSESVLKKFCVDRINKGTSMEYFLLARELKW